MIADLKIDWNDQRVVRLERCTIGVERRYAETLTLLQQVVDAIRPRHRNEESRS